jgi:hypothetical protein
MSKDKIAPEAQNRPQEEPKAPKVNKEQEAKIALAKEQQARASACQAKISQVLAEFNCEIAVGMLITPQGNQPHLQVVAKAS